MAKLIDGKQISAQIKDELKEEVAQMKERGTQVCLAVILVGQDPASCVYVRNKKKACEYIGIRSISCELPEETTQEELLEKIREFNEDDSVDGILVQLPCLTIFRRTRLLKLSPPKKMWTAFIRGAWALCASESRDLSHARLRALFSF